MKIKRMAIMLGIATVVFGGVFFVVYLRNVMIKQYFATMPAPVVAVTAEPAAETKWQSQVQAVGTLRAVNGVEVSSTVAGMVKEIAFQSGQTVKAGQLLVRLDTGVEESELRSAEASAQLSRTTADRNRKLFTEGHIAKAALDQAEADLRVKQAQAAANRAVIDKKVVAAPFGGTLGVRKVDLGQYVQPGQAIVSLQDISALLVDFSVSQKDIGMVTPGQPVRVTVDAYPDRSFEGSVTALDPLVDAKSGMVAVEAKIPNPDGALMPGMFSRIEVVRPQARSVITVPVTAVDYNLHGDAVFLVAEGKDAQGNPAKTATRAQVQVGERREGRIEVLSGLKPGDLVVTSGQLKLQNGSLVNVAATDPLQQPKKLTLE